jgi:SMI1 / KNR4 family (SUKH-1)
VLNLRKWKDLKQSSKLEVVVGESATRMKLNEIHEIEAFESFTKIILPNEYKEFCLIFGEGIFGINLFNIWSLPSYDLVEDIFSFDRDIILNCKAGCHWEKSFENKIGSALFFGRGDNYGTYFMFDLSSYSPKDLSCDIYGINCNTLNYSHQESAGTSYFLGRSFFRFIKEICIEDNGSLECPKLLPSKNTYLLGEDEPGYWNRKTFVVFGGEDESIAIPDDL